MHPLQALHVPTFTPALETATPQGDRMCTREFRVYILPTQVRPLREQVNIGQSIMSTHLQEEAIMSPTPGPANRTVTSHHDTYTVTNQRKHVLSPTSPYSLRSPDSLRLKPSHPIALPHRSTFSTTAFSIAYAHVERETVGLDSTDREETIRNNRVYKTVRRESEK